ncbi:response regulator transcription factor [Roseibacillus persicicus]|uniref:response regulator transcription factor n=1 Tax=Roseibacillus persicicus TaxID=454148 RepID=UPI0028107F55|nr:response regulator transcription factor [Roseibacillus persicicus]MDQ8188982.1 response regulator transcription factor [Roseibacillus persicicus]
MRLLLVEDDPLLLHSLSEGLREENYAVDTATDGQSGLSLAQEIDFDAIILDGMLPHLDGWDLLAQLRATKLTPVLMLTARDAVEDRIRGLDTGADDYLTKPFDFDELLARLRALIRRNRGQGRNTIELGDITLDLATRTLHRSGQPVSLTPREYALVEHLALHLGKVISRTELYEHLFDENEDSLSNLLDVHVSNIRKKLGSDFITTRRGHGYFIS